MRGLALLRFVTYLSTQFQADWMKPMSTRRCIYLCLQGMRRRGAVRYVFPRWMLATIVIALWCLRSCCAGWHLDQGEVRWVVENITCGKTHRCPIADKYPADADAHFLDDTPSTGYTADVICVWLSCRDKASGLLRIRELNHVELLDEHGMITSPNGITHYTGIGANSKRQFGHGMHLCEGGLWSPPIDPTKPAHNLPGGHLMMFQFRVIRSGIDRGFTVRLIGDTGQCFGTITTDVRYNPTPEPWSGKSLPQVASVGKRTARLEQLSLSRVDLVNRFRTPAEGWVRLSELWWHANATVSILDESLPSQQVVVSEVAIHDCFGNRFLHNAIRLSPLDAVWRIRIKGKSETVVETVTSPELKVTIPPIQQMVALTTDLARNSNSPQPVFVLGVGSNEIRFDEEDPNVIWKDLTTEVGDSSSSMGAGKSSFVRFDLKTPGVIVYVPPRFDKTALHVREKIDGPGSIKNSLRRGRYRLLPLPESKVGDSLHIQVFCKRVVEEVTDFEFYVSPREFLSAADLKELEQRVIVKKPG